MAEPNSYPIGTLLEMAAIPAEAQARFLAELPSILGEVRRVTEVQRIFNAQFAGVLQFNLEGEGPPVWIDDDKGIGTVCVRTPDGDHMRFERKIGPAGDDPA